MSAPPLPDASPAPPAAARRRRLAPWQWASALGGTVVVVGVVVLATATGDPDAEQDRLAREAFAARAVPAQVPAGVATLAATAEAMIAQTAVLVDARSPTAYAIGHLSQALPRTDVTAIHQQVGPPGRKRSVIVYGLDDQDPDTAATVATLRALGVTDLRLMAGGIRAWVQANGALTTASGEPGSLLTP